MRRILFALFLFLCLCVPMLVQAQDADKTRAPFDMQAFARLPVLHEGRVKPLDSFARAEIHKIAGSEQVGGRPALDVLADVVFDPAEAGKLEIIRLSSFDVKRQFGMLEGNKVQKLFSLDGMTEPLNISAPQYSQFLEMEEKERSKGQSEFIEVHQNAMLLLKLMRSFSLILPLAVDVPESFNTLYEESGYAQGEVDYLRISALQMPAAERLKQIIALKGEDLEDYTEEERKIALFSFQIETIQRAAEGNDLLKIIPGRWSTALGAEQEWFAPWQAIQQGFGSPDGGTYLALWRDMAAAYRLDDPARWDEAVAGAALMITNQDPALYSPFLFELELLYNALHPYDWASFFYLAASVLIGIFLLRPAAILRQLSLVSVGIAMGIHVFAIVARMLILDRPPVGTLYESVLFVALICVLAGFIAALRRGQDVALLAGSIAALGLLCLAPVILPKGESLEVLVAVLNTNFWLATHVTIITAGYGFCVLVASMAHIYMAARLVKPKSDPFITSLYKAIYKTSIVALLFTAVGTVLGGIWADQSWGRFWGWDPKENGALLIVLWIIWLQHGRLGGNLRDLSFAAGIAVLNVVVALAWFGVNLLSVGLHSYGFTSGIAFGLGAFCAAEFTIVGGLWFFVRQRQKKLEAAHAA